MDEERRYYEDEIDLKDLFLVLYRKRWLILLVTLSFFLLSVVFWALKNKEERNKYTWGIRIFSLKPLNNPFPSIDFPQIYEKNFFSNSIKPFLERFVKVKANYKKQRIQERREGLPSYSNSFDIQTIDSLELSGKESHILLALDLFSSKIIEITKRVLEDELNYRTSQIYQLNAQIEKVKVDIDNLKKERQFLIELKKEYKRPSSLPSIINLSPPLIPYLDIDTQIRGAKVKINDLQVRLEDLLGKLSYHKTIADYLRSVIPLIKKTPWVKEDEYIYSSETICNLLNNKLEGFKSRNPYILRAFYHISSEISFLCGELNTLKSPLYIRRNLYSKLVIIAATFLGLFIAIFLAFFVEFVQNTMEEIKKQK